MQEPVFVAFVEKVTHEPAAQRRASGITGVEVDVYDSDVEVAIVEFIR